MLMLFTKSCFQINLNFLVGIKQNERKSEEEREKKEKKRMKNEKSENEQNNI